MTNGKFTIIKINDLAIKLSKLNFKSIIRKIKMNGVDRKNGFRLNIEVGRVKFITETSTNIKIIIIADVIMSASSFKLCLVRILFSILLCLKFGIAMVSKYEIQHMLIVGMRAFIDTI